MNLRPMKDKDLGAVTQLLDQLGYQHREQAY